ncbi:HAD family phosphatase [Sphingobacterium sp. lm-10]|uniref:HAD family hydrolase n=1 Tax=Sphingobacterium sp. lm-10 TaxID=2944904 RepID=UPI00202038BD|nr:HAD family phosphatase [Sphingobacterium sp. lm-10]MCL7986780.1 HAD family phosphatase [Sphingobacterium sp. lm-10]
MSLNIAYKESDNFAVVFDMDGVIADTNPYHAKAFEAFFDRYKVNYTQEAFEQHMYGKHNSYIMQHFFGRPFSPQEIATLEAEKEGLFREIYKAVATPVFGLVDFLRDLQRHDFLLGVATSAPRANMNLVLDTLGIRDLFQSTLSSEDVSLHKPHPEVYLKSAEALHVSAHRVMVFEDSYSGVTAGTAAGMAVTGVLTSHKKEELPPCAAYIRDYRDIDAPTVKSLLK